MQDLNDFITGSTLTAAQFVEIPSEIQNVIEGLGITLSSGDLNQLGKSIAGYVANSTFYTDSGIADAYVLSKIGLKQTATAYTVGFKISFIAGNDNVGASTVNVAGLGVKSLKTVGGGVVPLGYIKGGESVTATFDGTDFILDNPLSNFTIPFDTLADAKASTLLREGSRFETAERSTGNGGGATYDVVLTSSVTPDPFKIIVSTAVPSLSFVPRIVRPLNIKPFGATGDGVANTDGIATASDATFTSALALWVTADIGKIISIAGAGAAGVSHTTTIASINSGQSIELTVAAVTTVASNAEYRYGTDDTLAMRAAFKEGGAIYIPDGIYLIDTDNRFDDDVFPDGLGTLFEPYMFTINQDFTEVTASADAFIVVTATSGFHANLFAIEAEDGIIIDGVRAEGVPYLITDDGNAETTGGIHAAIRMGFNGAHNWTNCTFKNNNFKHCLRGAITQSIDTDTSTNTHILNNVFSNVRGHMISMRKADSCKVKDNKMTTQQTQRENPSAGSGNTFTGMFMDISTQSKRCEISGNVCIDGVFGMKLEDDVLAGDYATNFARDHIVSNNLFKDINLNTQFITAVECFGIKITSERCSVINNRFLNVFGVGLKLVASDTFTSIISGNVIVGALGSCIIIPSDGALGTPIEKDRVIVRDNIINGTISGEAIPIGVNLTASHVTVTNNKIKNVSSAISLTEEAANCLISDNTIRGLSSTGINGSSVDIASTAITAFASGGVGVVVTSVSHGLSNNNAVNIRGTTSYNGRFTVTSITANTFEIVATFVADDATGTVTLGFSTNNTVIANNVIEADGILQHGINLTRCDNMSVVGNKIFSTTNGTVFSGIQMTAGASVNDTGGNLVANNKITNFVNGIFADRVTDIHITSNNIQGHGTADKGIFTTSVSVGLISGNMVIGPAEGIRTNVTSANVLIDSNNTSQCATGLVPSTSTVGTNV